MHYGAIPTLEEGDEQRPIRERQTLVGEQQTRLVNRIKAILARFGIRSFRISLRDAEDRLIAIHGTLLPDNTRAELHHLLEQLDLVRADPDHRGRPPSHRTEQDAPRIASTTSKLGYACVASIIWRPPARRFSTRLRTSGLASPP
ncbi:hypothetical protein [Mesorhizobium shangrilense]|uniref:Uncharacterized protein n=1 Tax=Mesorhizobium shangrilense TaxID=460060 RepID=A0ABV2DRY9_9HYPH